MLEVIAISMPNLPSLGAGGKTSACAPSYRPNANISLVFFRDSSAKPHHYTLSVKWAGLFLCIFFVAAGIATLPLIGIEDDEALFGQGNFPPRWELYAVRIFHKPVPLMHLSYLGALKSWVWAPVFKLFGTSLWTLRLPALLITAASIWLFYVLMERVFGGRAAVIGCALLATDAMYLFTGLYDWGPVALQHLLMIGGVLLLVRFHQTRTSAKKTSWPAVAGGFFLFGLALWDKALAIWMLSGMGIAAILTLPRQIIDALSPTRGGTGWVRGPVVALCAFSLGAFPLIQYNRTHHWETFAGTFQKDVGNLPAKANVLLASAGGNGMFGWLLLEDSQTANPHEPVGWLPKISASISASAGHPRHHLLTYLFAAALLLAPISGNLRAVLFGLIAMGVAWIQMAITANAGWSLHHTLLLWPMPQLMIGASLAGASRHLGRAGAPAVGAVAALAAISGGLVINEYYATMLRNGPTPGWTDAVLPLAKYLKDTSAKNVICMDWGFVNGLRVLDGGKLPLATGSVELSKPEMTAGDRVAVLRMISDSGDVFVVHTKEFESFHVAQPKLLAFAAENGYRRDMMAVIQDGHGRAAYEVFRFVKQ